MTFAPAAPSFTLPPHTLRRRPRRFRPPAAAVIHNGLSTEKLSTSLLATLCKTCSSSRLRTRIYNTSFACRPLPGSIRAAVGKRSRRCGPVSRVAERRVGEGEGKGGCPLAQCPALSPPKTEPLPAYERSAERKGGSAQGNPRPCPCVLPASARLRPSPCPLMAESLCAKAEVHKAIPAPTRAFSPRQPAYGRAPAAYGRITVRKGGSVQGNPRSCPCVLPASARLRPSPCPLMGEVPSAMAECTR